MLRSEVVRALIAAAVIMFAPALHPTYLVAQLTRDRVITGASVGVSDLHSPIRSTAYVATGIIRYQRPILSVEFGLPMYSYRTKVALSPDVEQGSFSLVPEVSLQLNRRFRGFELYLGAGPGLAIPLEGSSLSGAAVHAAGGVRLRVAEGVLARFDLRTRRVYHEPSMAELQVGLEGWPR